MDAPRRKRRNQTIRLKSGPTAVHRQDEPGAQIPRPVDFARLFERAPDPNLIVSGDGHYIDANRAACRLTGYTRDELLRMCVGDLVAASDRTYSAERFSLLRKAGRTRGDRILQRKDGTTVLVEAHAVSLGDGTFQTTLRDISERVKAREALQHSLDAYSMLVDLCHAAVISGGPEGRDRERANWSSIS